VATAAAVGIERRAQADAGLPGDATAHRIDLREPDLAVQKKFEFGRAEHRQRLSRTDVAGSDAGIAGPSMRVVRNVLGRRRHCPRRDQEWKKQARNRGFHLAPLGMLRMSDSPPDWRFARLRALASCLLYC
jgi:hypothetical protein